MPRPSSTPNVISIFVLMFITTLTVLASAYCFADHRFLYTAPAILLIMFMGLFFSPPQYYLSLFIGFFLEFGLYVAYLNYIEYGNTPIFQISLTVGVLGTLLVFCSLWQDKFGVWFLPTFLDTLYKILVLLGLAFIIIMVGLVWNSRLKNAGNASPAHYYQDSNYRDTD